MEDYRFAGGTAVVTGAGSGIGEALALGLARRGSDLALLDVYGDRLEAVAARVRAEHPGATVRTYTVDLASREDTARAAAAVLADVPRVTLLVNNAGVALVGRFDQTPLEQFWWVMDVNFRATVQLTHLFLPALKASPGSHIANTSSVFGMVGVPRQSAYGASKFAVRGFTDVLRAELRPHGIGVTSIHPGGTRTRIAADATPADGVPAAEADIEKRIFGALLTLSPEHVAEAALEAIEDRKGRVVVGLSAKLPILMERVAPTGYTHLMAASEWVIGSALNRWLQRRRRR